MKIFVQPVEKFSLKNSGKNKYIFKLFFMLKDILKTDG